MGNYNLQEKGEAKIQASPFLSDINTCMRYREFLIERRVKSSWIADLTIVDDNDVIMTLKSKGRSGARSYLIANVPLLVSKGWLKAPSKGKYWHKRIRGNFFVDRIG